MSARIEPAAYGGWENNLLLSNDEVELVVTLDVGPRILRYALKRGACAGRNALGEAASDLGGTGELAWKMRGGHRLWVAPEHPTRTYVPDNGPVLYETVGNVARVTTPADPTFGLEKTLEVSLAADGTEATVTHRLRNRGDEPTSELALWALTVMATGGTAIVPLPAHARHPGGAASTAEDFAPALTMSFWPYFSFKDDRVTLGDRFIRLRQDVRKSATKFGLQHRTGWAGYWNEGLLFAKTVPWTTGVYPDGGCNFETYTDSGILELETLSPLTTLAPGAEIVHVERWHLFGDVPAPADEAAIAANVAARFV